MTGVGGGGWGIACHHHILQFTFYSLVAFKLDHPRTQRRISVQCLILGYLKIFEGIFRGKTGISQ